jgi:membrane protease YdiL (CAAX protease family)
VSATSSDLQRPGCTEAPRLRAGSIIALHLAPGIVFSAFLLYLSGVFTRHGLSSYLAEIVSIPLVLAPMLAGIILLWNRRSGRVSSLIHAVTYRERSPALDYILWPILLYICWTLLSLPVLPLTGILETRLFSWFPARLGTGALISGVRSSPSAQRHAAFVMALIFSGLLAPLAEEAYFRGFLLPRMRHLGWKAPVVNAFLFGLYHFFCPWNLPAVFVAFLPVALVVQARKDFRISILVHALFNLTGVLTLFLRA